MKTLISSEKIVGVYQTITTLPDALVADTTLLPFKALGNYMILDGVPPSMDSTWNGSMWVPPPGDPAEVQKESSKQIQLLLDTTAQAHGYDTIISLCSYANSTNLTWQKEGQYGCNFRDACWGKAEQIQTDVQAGTRPLPTVEEVLAEMPAVVWPT